MSKEAMKLALEALTATMSTHGFREHIEEAQDKAIEALEEALAKQEQGEQLAKLGWQEIDCPICGGGARAFPKQEQGEPVAWRTFDGEGLYFYCSYEDNETYADVWNKRNPNHKGWVEPLYTTPQQRTWVGLTTKDQKEIERQSVYVEGAIRMTEAKLKEKNSA